jgi:hypothetical protein
LKIIDITSNLSREILQHRCSETNGFRVVQPGL